MRADTHTLLIAAVLSLFRHPLQETADPSKGARK